MPTSTYRVLKMEENHGRLCIRADLREGNLAVDVVVGEYVADVQDGKTVDVLDVRVSGMVKWDGCSNWSIAGLHGCGRQEVVELGQQILRAYDMAVRVGKLGPEGDSWRREHGDDT